MIRVLLVDDQSLVRSGFKIILESEADIEVIGEARNGAEAIELTEQHAPDVICMDVEMPLMDGIEASRRILGGRIGAVSPGSSSGAPAGPSSSAAGGTSRDQPAAPAILVLTTFGHERYLFDALAAGVSGFLLKTSRAEQLIDAVRTLAAGDALLGPDVTRAVIAQVTAGTGAGAGPGGAGGTGSAGAGSPGAEAGAAERAEAETPEAGDDGGAGSAAHAAMVAAGLTERERDVLGLLSRGWSNAEIAAELFLGEATVKTHVSNLLQKLGVRDRIQAVVWVHTRAAG